MSLEDTVIDSELDTNPKLSVRVVDEDKEDWDKIGRLYRKPDFILPENYRSVPVLRELIRSGDLMPSVTNVLAVRNSPYLVKWAAKLVATEAVSVAQKFPHRITEAPQKALYYLKNIPDNEKKFWGKQGTKIHAACELLALGKSIDHIEFTEYEKLSIERWKEWLDLFQPKFGHLEITGFGETNDMKYAGTADFTAEINGVKTIGDYKCAVNSTPVLLPSGISIRADEVQLGQEVVAWTKDKGLHISKVSYVGDNGKHSTVRMVTANGQELEVTKNHPMLASRDDQNFGWVKAEDLKLGDTLYVALGWNYSPHFVETAWPYAKYFSPYLFGLVWALSSFSKEKWTVDTTVELPKLSRPTLREELSDFGFTFNKQGIMNVKPGLEKIARKNKTTVEEVLAILTPERLPEFVYSAPAIARQAVISGVQEIFANKEIHEKEFYIVFNNADALKDLHQFYTNHGQVATIGSDANSGMNFLRVPFAADDTIFVHGPTATRIVELDVNEEPTSTVAIEVEGSHTHVTGGLISHNTNRSGLHIDIALQLAANARATHITPDSLNLIPMPTIEKGIGVHISPKGVETVEVDISDKVMDVFSALRSAWSFHVFEGKTDSPTGVMIRKIKTPKDL